MAKRSSTRCPALKFRDTLNKIIQEYAQDVETDINEVTKEVGKAGATALRKQSRATFNGTEYAKRWKSEYTETRYNSQSIIYNEWPGLPHLLEHGHAMRGGGRVSGRPHISIVEEQIVEQYMKGIESKL